MGVDAKVWICMGICSLDKCEYVWVWMESTRSIYYMTSSLINIITIVITVRWVISVAV